MTILLSELFLGVVLLALASFVFSGIEGALRKYARLRTVPGLDSLAVVMVLGGWAAGAVFVIRSIGSMIW